MYMWKQNASVVTSVEKSIMNSCWLKAVGIRFFKGIYVAKCYYEQSEG